MKKLLSCCAAILLSSSILVAQAQPTPVVAKQPAPTFKVHSQLVLVPVVVNDKEGKHIPGLAKDKFRVEEDGKSQSVAMFEEVILPEKPSGSVAKTATDRASNFSGVDGRPSHFTMIVLDMVNTPFLKQADGRRQLIEFLSKGLKHDEPITLLGLNNRGIVQLHSFTTDTEALIQALRILKGEIGMNETADAEHTLESENNADLLNSAGEISQTISQFLQDSIDQMAAMQQRDSTRRTLDALNQIARAYSGDRVRKTLIWASSGFPFMINDPHAFASMGVDMVQEYEQTWKALTSANIAVYPVELTGLDPRGADASQRRQRYQPGRAGRGNPMGTNLGMQYDASRERQETLKAFADATGGRPCLNSNDFKKCFGDAIEDSRSYYLLGYYIPGDNVKAGWRKLKVRVEAPGSHVRAREGFYATAPAEDTPAVRRDEIVKALSSPFEYTGVVLDVRSGSSAAVQAKEGEPGRVMQDFIVHIPSSTLAINSENKNRIDLEIAAVALDKSGRDVARFSQNVQVNFSPEMLARVTKAGIGLKEQLQLIPGQYECRFVVRDNQSGQIGTVHMKFEEK